MLLAWLLGIATLLGGIAAALTFLPRVTIAPSDPVDPQDPFSASFTVTNAGFIPLREVGVSFFPGEIDLVPLPFNENHRPRFPLGTIGGLSAPEWNHHALNLDERFTITPMRLFAPPNHNISGADIAIVANYQPWIIPWKRQRVFRFVTHRQANGNLYWYSYPLE